MTFPTAELQLNKEDAGEPLEKHQQTQGLFLLVGSEFIHSTNPGSCSEPDTLLGSRTISMNQAEPPYPSWASGRKKRVPSNWEFETS